MRVITIRVPLKTVLDAIPADVRTDQRSQDEMEVDHLLRTDGQAAEATRSSRRAIDNPPMTAQFGWCVALQMRSPLLVAA